MDSLALQRRALLGVAVATVLVVSLLTVRASGAAFVATTSTAANNWTTGAVILGSNGAGAALFTGADLGPGDEVARCIRVEYDGTVAADVHLHGGDLNDPDDLADELLVRVDSGAGDAGTAGTFGACDGFVPDTSHLGTELPLSDFAGAHVDFATGLGGWTPAGAEHRTYRIRVRLDDSSTNQAAATTYRFTWEARSP